MIGLRPEQGVRVRGLREPPRLQFSLRWLFVVVTATALCALVYRLTGAVETAGVAVAFVLCGLCLKMPQCRHRGLLQGGLLAIATLILWIVGVDYSVFWEGCDHCNSHWDVEEIRIFHQPVLSRQGEDHSPSLRLIAEDLGAPCPHAYGRWHKWRLWGFFWPGPPFINGILSLSGGDWREDQDHVRSLGRRDSKIGREFQSALIKQDYKTVSRLISDVRPPNAADAASR
jgi:hypothetical protein